jgi:ribosomal-protein-serine acetyltransferase
MLIATLGDGLELRLLELRHAPVYHRLIVRNYSRLYWLPAEPTLQDAERRLRAGLSRFAEGTGVDGGIFDRGTLVGFAGLFDIDPSFKSAEIGYWIDMGAEGRGLVHRASAALLRYAFDELDLHRVALKCAATNAASIRVAERLGFRLEGRLIKADRVGDEWVDFLIYGMLDEEWQAQGATKRA